MATELSEAPTVTPTAELKSGLVKLFSKQLKQLATVAVLTDKKEWAEAMKGVLAESSKTNKLIPSLILVCGGMDSLLEALWQHQSSSKPIARVKASTKVMDVLSPRFATHSQVSDLLESMTLQIDECQSDASAIHSLLSTWLPVVCVKWQREAPAMDSKQLRKSHSKLAKVLSFGMFAAVNAITTQTRKSSDVRETADLWWNRVAVCIGSLPRSDLLWLTQLRCFIEAFSVSTSAVAADGSSGVGKALPWHRSVFGRMFAALMSAKVQNRSKEVWNNTQLLLAAWTLHEANSSRLFADSELQATARRFEQVFGCEHLALLLATAQPTDGRSINFSQFGDLFFELNPRLVSGMQSDDESEVHGADDEMYAAEDAEEDGDTESDEHMFQVDTGRSVQTAGIRETHSTVGVDSEADSEQMGDSEMLSAFL